MGKRAEIFDAPEYIEYHKYLGDLTDDLLKKNNYNGQNMHANPCRHSEVWQRTDGSLRRPIVLSRLKSLLYTVKVDGSKLGVVTDLDGKFSIDAAPDATLTITYVGMEPKTVKAEAGKTLSITLKDDSKVLVSLALMLHLMQH